MANDTTSPEATTETPTDIEDTAVWTEHHENILIEWADKATCFRWLHAKSHIDYSHFFYKLPKQEKNNLLLDFDQSSIFEEYP